DAPAFFAQSKLEDLLLEAGEARLGIELVLRPGCTIRGAVRGAPAELAGSLRVYAHSGGGRALASARTDADGSFVLRGLQVGTYELRALGGGLASPGCTVEARVERDGEVELRVAPGASLRIGARWAA